MEEHRIVHPVPRNQGNHRKNRTHLLVVSGKTIEGRRGRPGRRWKSKEDGQKKNITGSEA
jgi:hypothetical protein